GRRSRGRDHRIGRDDGADRGRNGGARRSDGRRPDRLRHGEGRRLRDGAVGRAARREDERGRVKAAVLTVSDGVDMGTRQDASGDLLEELLVGEGFEVVRRVVPDERASIAAAIEELADEARLVLTTGGTGVGPRDVTPEATASVLERIVP